MLILEEIKMTMKLPTEFDSLTGSLTKTLREFKRLPKKLTSIGLVFVFTISKISVFQAVLKGLFLTIVPLQIQLQSVMIDDFVYS